MEFRSNAGSKCIANVLACPAKINFGLMKNRVQNPPEGV